MNYLFLTLLWIVYFVLHSLLASDVVKLFAQKVLGNGYRYYRIIYSLISAVGLLAILFYQATLPAVLLFAVNGMTRYLSMLLATAGVLIISQAFREHRFFSFIGLQAEIAEFRRTGILKYIRHPIYSGTILIMLGFFIFNPTIASLISMACVFLYLPVGISLEEKKLIRHYGDEYLTYKDEVPALIPRFRKR